MLGSLRKGERARVESVDASTPFGRRLVELGFAPGTEVLALGSAPLGDPLLFELRGARLSLRRSEADRVRVVPLEAGPE